MATLDSSIVNLALTAMTRDFNVDLSHVKWVVILYFFIITTFLLPVGRLSDLIGRRQIFLTGYVTFSIGSALCGLALGPQTLLLFRAVQAVGAAMIMANGPAIITTAFPGNQRGSALGILAMAVSAGLISGPAIGGVLIHHLGWRSIFLINIPIGLLGAFLVKRCSPPDRTPQGSARHFDWLGTVLQSVLLGAVLVFFDLSSMTSLHPQTELLVRTILLVVIITVGAVFLQVESRAREPLVDLKLFRLRTFSVAGLSGFLSFVSYSGVAVLLPFFFQNVMVFDAERTGLLMTLIPLTILVVAPLSGRMSDRLGSREICFVGALALALAEFWMAGGVGPGLHTRMNELAAPIALAAVGLGLGLFQSPNNNAIMSAVPKSKLGVASALMAAVRNLGLVVGTGMTTEIFSWRYRQTNDLVSATHVSLMVCAGFAVLGAVSSLAKPKGPHWS